MQCATLGNAHPKQTLLTRIVGSTANTTRQLSLERIPRERDAAVRKKLDKHHDACAMKWVGGTSFYKFAPSLLGYKTLNLSHAAICTSTQHSNPLTSSRLDPKTFSIVIP